MWILLYLSSKFWFWFLEEEKLWRRKIFGLINLSKLGKDQVHQKKLAKDHVEHLWKVVDLLFSKPALFVLEREDLHCHHLFTNLGSGFVCETIRGRGAKYKYKHIGKCNCKRMQNIDTISNASKIKQKYKNNQVKILHLPLPHSPKPSAGFDLQKFNRPEKKLWHEQSKIRDSKNV